MKRCALRWLGGFKLLRDFLLKRRSLQVTIVEATRYSARARCDERGRAGEAAGANRGCRGRARKVASRKRCGSGFFFRCRCDGRLNVTRAATKTAIVSLACCRSRDSIQRESCCVTTRRLRVSSSTRVVARSSARRLVVFRPFFRGYNFEFAHMPNVFSVLLVVERDCARNYWLAGQAGGAQCEGGGRTSDATTRNNWRTFFGASARARARAHSQSR